MPVFVLKVKCELDNVASMQADENNKWILTMQSPDAGERREHVEVTKARNEELDGSRGTANFIVKWQGAKKQATANIVEIKKVTTQGLIKGDQSGEFVPIFALDCRGLEPVEWHPSTDFAVTSEGGTVYASDGVDLSEEDWSDYCEKSAAPVSIMEIEHKFEVA
ncbi:unnamed protein product [Ectocarpus sp. CCAP 1310/34]|nr:unnamed protein product [Ectocarpus sp. CCAP 1310/34]